MKRDIKELKLDRFPYHKSVFYRTKDIQIFWTESAQTVLTTRKSSLTVEMQLLFSCVPKKRVIFHEVSLPESVNVIEKLKILFRPVQPQRCDPQAFATTYPEEKILDSAAARRMQPQILTLDYRDNAWHGEYLI